MCYDGWGICFKQHICVHGKNDDFNEMQEKIKNADAYIYVTPVYWGEISEDLKLFWDRLRRCETSKAWNGRDDDNSFHMGKPSIIIAAAGGGCGGILNTLVMMERYIDQLNQHSGFKEGTAGVFDYIAVNRWNAEYKLVALRSAIEQMVAINKGDVKPLPMNHLKDVEKF